MDKWTKLNNGQKIGQIEKNLTKSAKIEKSVKTVKIGQNSDKIEKLDKREHKLTNYNENYLKY